MDEVLIQSMWSSMCQSALSHAASMSRIQQNDVASALIAAETKKFTQQAFPATQEELARRQTQQFALSTRVAAISHAASMVKMHPSVSTEVFRHLTQFCVGPLPGNSEGVSQLQSESLALSSKLSALCHANAMDRLRGSFKDDLAFDAGLRLGSELSDDDIKNEANDG